VQNSKVKVKNKKQKVETAARAQGRYLKISPSKMWNLMDNIRGKTVAEAETILKFSGKRGGGLALKVLRSAQANAKVSGDKGSWVVTDARADKGSTFRRRMDPKPRGVAGVIRTSSTHLTIGVGPRVGRAEEVSTDTSKPGKEKPVKGKSKKLEVKGSQIKKKEVKNAKKS